jgi:hypothetical protein
MVDERDRTHPGRGDVTMSGTIQARAMRWTGDSQIAISPNTCPMSIRNALVTQLFCFQKDPHEAEHYCPYFVDLTLQTDPTTRVSVETLDVSMKAGGRREMNCRVICSEAKPTTPPGA